MKFHAPQDLNPVAREESGMSGESEAGTIEGGFPDEAAEPLLTGDKFQLKTFPVLSEELIDSDLRGDDVADGSHDGIPSSFGTTC